MKTVDEKGEDVDVVWQLSRDLTSILRECIRAPYSSRMIACIPKVTSENERQTHYFRKGEVEQLIVRGVDAESLMSAGVLA